MITAATLSISSLRVYSSKGPYLSVGTLGAGASLAYNESVHSTTVSFTPGSGLASFSAGSVPITVYSTQSTSGNMVNLRDGCVLTLSITYQVSSTASTGSLNKSSVEIGGSVTLTISSSTSSNAHTTTWTLGSNTWHQDIPSGGTASSYIIPESWASAITGSSATARVTLSTYSSYGTFIGSNSYNFTVTLPTSTAPTIGSFAAERVLESVPSGWGIYVQGKSKTLLKITGAAGSSGSSITSYRFSGGGYNWSSSTDASYTTGFLTQAGDVVFTGTVTDSRGYSASKTLTVSVVAYEQPSIAMLTAYRCVQNGTASETGAYVNVRCDAVVASVGGRNTYTLSVSVRKVGTGVWSSPFAVTSGQSAVLNAGLSGTDLYEIRAVVTDTFGPVEKITDITAAQYAMFFPNGGLNVSIGKAGSRTNALEVNPNWRIYHGDTDVTPRLTGTLAVMDGGTGATTPSGALANLGAAAVSHNHSADNITSGTLPVARGGTGATSLTAGRAVVTSATGTLTTATATAAQLGYLSNVTSDIQTQLNGKVSLKVAYGRASINGNTAVMIGYSGAGFSSLPYISVTYSTSDVNWSGDNGAIKVYNKTTTSASVIVGGSFPTNREVDWIALGW